MKYIKTYPNRQSFDSDMPNLEYPILALIEDTNETISLLRAPEPEPVTYDMTSDWLQFQPIYAGQPYDVHLTIMDSNGNSITLQTLDELTITNDSTYPWDIVLGTNNTLTLTNNSGFTEPDINLSLTLQYEDAILTLNAVTAKHTYTAYISNGDSLPPTQTAVQLTMTNQQDFLEGEVYVTVKDENDNYVDPAAGNVGIGIPSDNPDGVVQHFDFYWLAQQDGEQFRGLMLKYTDVASVQFRITISAHNDCTVTCVYETAKAADIKSALPVVNDILDVDTATAYDETQYDDYQQLADEILS